MTRRALVLILMLAFGLAPLAQAVDCVMNTTMAPDCPMVMTQEPHKAMPVADCFLSLKNGVMPLSGSAELPLLTALPAVMPEVRLPPIQVAERMPVRTYVLRAPPDDILLLTARRRI